MPKRNLNGNIYIDTDYLYDIYKDETSDTPIMTKEEFIDWVESQIEDMIREGEI